MAMIARVAEDKQNLLQPKNVWQKMQQDTSLRKEKEDTVIGKAAEVYISKAGKKLSEEANDPLNRLSQTDFMTDAEKQLSKLWQEEKDKAEYKKQAAEIEERLEKDSSLTDKEREKLQAEADELRKKGMTTDDKLYDLYDQKHAIEKNGGKYLESDLSGLQRQISELEWKIYNTGIDIKHEGWNKDKLTQQALKERAYIAIAENEAKIMGGELEKRNSENAMLTRTAEQIAVQMEENGKHQPTAADVVRAAVEEGKDRAEKAEDETGKLADQGLDSAMKMQAQMQANAEGLTGAEAEADRNTALRKLKKLSYEEFMRDVKNKECDMERY
ncbi:hypothetical protein [Selenomonas ruminantium]|uniref:hypothetical protein n=1 Tax=Selenomonas ruminantium TaxID=971 RepID=UPI00042170E8|nr:hypothetical protein [Selenomonas ruminantium]